MTLSLERLSLLPLPLTIWGLQGSYSTIVIKARIFGKNCVFVLAKPCWSVQSEEQQYVNAALRVG